MWSCGQVRALASGEEGGFLSSLVPWVWDAYAGHNLHTQAAVVKAIWAVNRSYERVCVCVCVFDGSGEEGLL